MRSRMRSATAIALIYPELKGKLNGHAVRAPVLNASLTDCVFELKRPASADEVNTLFRAAAAGPLAGILGYEERPLVSADYARALSVWRAATTAWTPAKGNE